MAVDKKQVRIAVVIIIKKLQPPTAQQLCRGSDLARLIGKDQFLVVVIKTEELLIDVGDEKILPTIAVVIGRINAHTGTRPPGFAVCDTRRQTDLFKLALALIQKK